MMIAMCRSQGIPARYVSGHLLGEGASHAWVEVRDRVPDAPSPTTRPTPAVTDLRYVTVAVGRDYRDVAPDRRLVPRRPARHDCRCASERLPSQRPST